MNINEKLESDNLRYKNFLSLEIFSQEITECISTGKRSLDIQMKLPLQEEQINQLSL